MRVTIYLDLVSKLGVRETAHINVNFTLERATNFKRVSRVRALHFL